MENKDKQFITGLENNLDEIKTEQAAGTQIEENLAQAGSVSGSTPANQGASAAQGDFLTPEEEKVQKELLAEKKRVNVGLIIAIVVVALGLAAGAGFAAVKLLGGGQTTNTGGNMVVDDDRGDGNGSDGENGGNNSTNVEEIAVDDELVQRLWHNFDIVTDAWSKTRHFYVDEAVAQGEVSDMLMIAVALSQIEQKPECVGDYVPSWNSSLSMSEYGCYDVETLRAKVKEIFDKEIELTPDEVLAYNHCHGWTLSGENNEIYDSIGPGCGGSDIPVIVRGIEKAERSGDDIYIYEWAYMENPGGVYHLGTEAQTYEVDGGIELGLDSLELGEIIAANVLSENGNEILEKVNAEDYRDQFDQFRWTFTKNAEGNYVFAGLERL